MPKKTKSITRKAADKIRSDKIKTFFYGVIAAMVVMLGVMFLVRYEVKDRASLENRVSLGAMTYDFTAETATKRTDETVVSLRNFLTETAKKATSDSCLSYYSVVQASADEKQVLLGYGCGAPTARMFAVNDQGVWRTISPTNQFDNLGIPACSHVDENNIDKSIAPVCAERPEDAQTTTYKVR